METNIKPCGLFIVCRIVARPAETTAGGIVLPTTGGAKSTVENVGRVRVYAVGPEVTAVRPGDVAILGEGKAALVMDGGKQFVIVHETVLLAVDVAYKSEDADTEATPSGVVTLQ